MTALLTEMGFQPRNVMRGGNSVTYFKQCEHIEDLLTTIGAPAAAVEMMTTKLEKELVNNANRAMNCDMANVNKTLDAAMEQCMAIEILRDAGRLEFLPKQIRETALLRLQYPELSLVQLAEKCSPPVTKSCINHRMRKIMETARDLDE
jgi:DNA-binding protein WhiA